MIRSNQSVVAPRLELNCTFHEMVISGSGIVFAPSLGGRDKAWRFMMRIFFVVFMLISFPVLSREVSVGDTTMQVRQPEGFVRVTEDMPAVYKYLMSSDNPTADIVDIFIEESGGLIALQGGIPDLSRRLVVQSIRSDHSLRMDLEEFAEFRSWSKRNIEDMSAEALRDHPGVMKRASSAVSELLESEVSVGNYGALYLAPHFEDERQIAYSSYVRSFIVDESGRSDGIFVTTTNTILVNGYPLTVLAVGAESDIEWTREAVKGFSNMILSDNDNMVEVLNSSSLASNQRSGSAGMNGLQMFFAVVFGVIGSYYGARVIKNKNSSRPNSD